MKALTVLALIFLAVSCGYEKEKIGAAPVPVIGSGDGDGTIIGPQRVIDTSTEIRLGRNHPLMKKDIFALMEVFFTSFVETELDPDGVVKDTAINFDGMYILRLQRDLDFLKLVSAIENKMAEPKILVDRNVAFKLSFYINAYNYFALRLINKNYLWKGKRIDSILELGNLNGGLEVFSKKLFLLEGERLSLNDIATVKIAELTRNSDGRIPFMLHCLGKGCPFLVPESIKPETLEMQLDGSTNQNLLLSRNFRIEVDGKVSLLNQIFNWYKDIFIKDLNGGIRGFLKKHLPEGQLIHEDVEFISHDWTLNKTDEFPIKIPEIKNLDSLPNIRPIVTDDDDDDDGDDDDDDDDDDRPVLMKACEKFITNPMIDIIARCMEVIDPNVNGARKTVIAADLCILEQELVEQEGEMHIIAGTIKERKKRGDDSEAVETNVLISDKSVRTSAGFSLRSKNKYKNIVNFNGENLILNIHQKVKYWGFNYRNVKLQCIGFL